MGQAGIIILTGTILVGAVVLFTMQRDTMDADEMLAEHQVKVLARNAASTGLNMAVRKLADSHEMGTWRESQLESSFSGDYKAGSYFVEMFDVEDANGIVSGDVIDVVSRGQYGAGEQVLFARYERAEDDESLPPAFRNVITTDLYIQLDGNVLVSAIDNSFNASIHTNDDLDVQGMSFLVEGYGTYTGELNIAGNRDPEDMDGNFIPNIDYNPDEPNVHWADSVHIDPLDPEALASSAQRSGAYYTGDLTIEGEALENGVINFRDPDDPFWENVGGYTCSEGVECGTKDNPFTLFVEGNVEFINRVGIEGYGVIYGTDDVVVTPEGSGGGVFGGLSSDNETIVTVASGQDIVVDGNACMGLGPERYVANNGREYNNNQCNAGTDSFEAGITLYAEGRVEFGGTPFLVGGIVAPETHFRGGGNPWVSYASPTKEVIDIGFEYIVPIGPILIAYSEW